MIHLVRYFIGSFLRGATWLAFIGLIALGYFGFIHLGPGTPTTATSGTLEALLQRVSTAVVTSLPTPDTPRKLLVLPIEGDRSDHLVRDRLAEAVLASGKWEVVDRTFMERTLEATGLNWGGDASAPEPDAAVRAARRANADAVLVGKLDRLRAADPAAVDISWQIYEAAHEAQTPLHQESLAVSLSGGAAEGPSFFARTADAGWALLIWVGAALLLPLFLAGVLSNFLDRESNLTNLGLLLALTLCNLGLALVLMGLQVNGLLDALLLLTAGIAGGAYNYLLLDKLEELRAR